MGVCCNALTADKRNKMSVLGLGEGVSDPIDRPRPAFEAFDPHTVVWIQDRMTQTRRILPPGPRAEGVLYGYTEQQVKYRCNLTEETSAGLPVQ